MSRHGTIYHAKIDQMNLHDAQWIVGSVLLHFSSSGKAIFKGFGEGRYFLDMNDCVATRQ